MLAIILYGIGVVLCSGIAILTTLLWLRKRIQRDTTARYNVVDPKGIEVLEAVEINGVKQWLHIRGRNRDNPVLLFLHGGPGFSNIGWYDQIQRPWEDHFTVVQWDQRLSGKSKSYRSIEKFGHTVTTQQMVADAESVIAHLRDRLNKEKVFLMGWSNGTNLGMRVVKNRPEWLYAYIGVGQITNMMEHSREEHALFLNYAEQQGKVELVERLKAMMPHPDPKNRWGSFAANSAFIAIELSKIGKSGLRHTRYADWLDMVKFRILTSPHYTLSELYRAFYGGSPVSQQLGEEFMGIDLPKEIGSEFEAPVFFFTGRHDWHIPCSQSDDWFQKINAPYKEQIWFEESAHCAQEKEVGKFLEALITNVLPTVNPTQPTGN